MSPDEPATVDSATVETGRAVGGRLGKPLVVLSGLVVLVVALLVPVVVGDVAVAVSIATLVGFLSLAAGGLFVWRRARNPPRSDPFPAVETRTTVTLVGAPFAGRVREGYATVGGAAIDARESVRDELRAIAARRVADRRGYDRETAAAAVRDGDWDAPATARAMLASDEAAEDIDTGRFLEGIRPDPPYRRRVAATVRTLADEYLGEGDEPAWESLAATPTTGDRWAEGVRVTGRWRGVAGVGLLALGLAAVTRTAGPGLLGSVLLGLAGYARVFAPPAPDLDVERTVAGEPHRPGDAVTVTVTLRNEGDATLPDCRLVDDVPDRLAVVDGSPRHATALRPGEETSYAYDVRAVYGDHRFDRALAVTRDVAGQRERRTRVESGAATLSCDPRTVEESVPLHPETTGVTGNVPAESGGSGIAFRSVREYRPGDPLGRVDWARLAKTGDLATLEFQAEHAATVVLLVDARTTAGVAPTDTALSAVDRSLAGAAQAVGELLSDGDRVGFAAVAADRNWVRPGTGTAHRDRLSAAIGESATVESGDRVATRFAAEPYVTELRRRLPASSQLVCFSPLLDDEVVEVVRRLQGHGYPITVFSPDPTTTDTIGGCVARLEREARLSDLRRAGVRVVDWPAGTDLAGAIERARRGWGR